MKDFRGKTAVVTGAASGIGRALATQCAREGMSVAVADVDEPGLEETQKQLVGLGADVLAVPTDVSKVAAVEALAERTCEAFGGVHLVFNNAGVLLSGCAWERSSEDWEWVLGVNLFGVIHGARVFLPIMVEQGETAHMVNTASVGGVVVGPFIGPYIVSKHAVVALTESLHYELEARGAKVKVSALCPGAVDTGITSSERVRPGYLGEASPLGTEAEKAFAEGLRAGIGAGISPSKLATHAFAGVREERFWIFPDPSYRVGLQARTQSMLDGVNPVHPSALQVPAADPADPEG
jgi:NAD(P)-dependent dehydrogenase (short-subunit alcohol dehydrogenase family)